MRTEDGYIIQQCLDGDSAMFGFLVDKYKSCVYALAYSKVRNFHDAQDITQEVFIKVYRNLHTLKNWDNFMGWLCRITVNICKNWIRSASRRPDSEFAEDYKLDYSYVKSYHEDRLYESVQEALDSLPEMYRQVLTLRYFGGMTVKEISNFLSVSPSTVDRRISEAHTRLKEEMLTMISTMKEQHELPATFTFRIVEAVKNIRINPVSPIKSLPWGLSLAMGIIAAIIGFNTNLNFFDKSEFMTGDLSQGEAKVLNVGEFPVNVMKVSDVSVMSDQYHAGNGLGSVVPSLQNAFFMAPQAEGGTWTKKADMPTARWALSTSVVNGKIYAVGGSIRANGRLDIVSIVEEYDPEINKWTTKASMPTARNDLASCEANGKIYTIGGNLWGKKLSIVEEYDPVTNRWVQKADMPTPRGSLSVSIANGKIYAIGGDSKDGFVSAIEEYDPIADKWVKKENMLNARGYLCASTMNGKIYVIGGTDDNGQYSTVMEYDPVKDKWVKKADMLSPRTGLSACAVNGRIYAIGGIMPSSGLIDEYDPSTDT